VGPDRTDDTAGEARGRPRDVDVREVLNAILYVLCTGCQWQALPKDLPPRARRIIISCCGTGTARSIAFITRSMWRCANRPPAKPAERGDHRQPERQGGSKRGSALDPQGYDAGKKVTGRKRHILVDTLGLLLNVAVHPANIQDRDGVALVLDQRTRRLFPFIERVFADGGYQGRKPQRPPHLPHWIIDIVKRPDTAIGFEVVPKRWIVERTLAWISRCRRLARDFERYARTVAAFIRLAMIRLMLRRLTRSNSCR